jgi:DnaJ domain
LLVLFIIHIFFATVAHPRLAASIAGHHNLRTMNPESKYFDSIRVKPRHQEADRHAAPCQWPGCSHHGGYRAPKGRRAEGEYHDFCLEHVKEYNKTYNYFAGMDEEAVRGFQKADATGHRPTWKLGQNSWAELNGGRFRRNGSTGRSSRDPFSLFGDSTARPAAAPVPRALLNGQRKALESLGLDEHATPEQVKAQYKSLVKRFHPDANGGSRAMEDRFREIIQAYDRLKSSGFC